MEAIRVSISILIALEVALRRVRQDWVVLIGSLRTAVIIAVLRRGQKQHFGKPQSGFTVWQ
jgi:hypothetical protein